MATTECNDQRCPMHGSLKTHGRELEGVVVSDRMRGTVIIEHPYTTFLQKYKRSLRKNSRVPAHKPGCMQVKLGDTVAIVETRRLSKTKSFVVTKVLKTAENK